MNSTIYLASDGTTMSASDFTLGSTWHLSKLTCLREAYFVHVILCWLVFLAGIGAMVSRVIPQIKWTHAWFGRAYIIFMLWNTASSLLIHNTGLPYNTLILFSVLMIEIATAWPIIKLHQSKIDQKALIQAGAQLAKAPLPEGKTLEGVIKQAKMEIVNKKTCFQRFFSYKALHGILMVMSWGSIAGRIFASNQSGDFQCHTYPVYKPINAMAGPTKGMDLAGQPLELVPRIDPRYDRLPWAAIGEVTWSIMLVFAWFLGCAIVGGAISYCNSRKEREPSSSLCEKLVKSPCSKVLGKGRQGDTVSKMELHGGL